MTDQPYAPILSRAARRALAELLPVEWRILYVIDDRARTVTVRSIRHRLDAYKV